MVEAVEEATYVPQHKQRLTLFFSAMRHFRQSMQRAGREVDYVGVEGFGLTLVSTELLND